MAWTLLTDGARAERRGPDQGATARPDYEAAYSDFFYDDMVIGAERMISVGAVLSSPAVDGETLYFGSWDGQLYAVG